MGLGGLVREAWTRAVRANEERRTEMLRQRGYDECQLCGEQIPVHPDDEKRDILERAIEHAEAREDHVNDPEQGWMLADE